MRIARHPRRAGNQRLQSGADDAARLRGVRHLRRAGDLEKLRGIGQVGGHLEAVEESGLDDRDGSDHPQLGGRRRADHTEAYRFFEERIRARPRGGGADRRARVCSCTAPAPRRASTTSRASRSRSAARSSAPNVPIVLGLDHHANVTRKMVENEHGDRRPPHAAARSLRYRQDRHGAADPHHQGRGEAGDGVAQDPAALAPGAVPHLPGADEGLVRPGARAGEADPRVLQVSNYPMQPWLDVAEGGWATSSSPTATRRSPSGSPTKWPISPGRCATTSRSRRRCRSTRRCAWPMPPSAASSCSATPATRCSAAPPATAT